MATKQKQHRGITPNRNDYRMITTITVVNRAWEIYISEKSFPSFINWKIILSPESGKYYKANYSIAYYTEEDRLTHTAETEQFRIDFPREVEEWIIAISRYLVEREYSGEEKEEENVVCND